MAGSFSVAVAISALGATVLVCALFLLLRRRKEPDYGKHATAASQAAVGANAKDGFSAHIAPRTTLLISHAQDVGKRSQQQDAYSVVIEATRVVSVVCDGMGGMEMGGEAARLAVSTLIAALDGNVQNIQETMLAALNMANSSVYELCGGKGGATVVLTLINSDGLYYMAAGDSHMYILRDGFLRQIGQDHIFYYDLLRHVRGGSITLEEANLHPEREHLTSFLGKEMLNNINGGELPIRLKNNDVLLICTDGVYRSLSEQELAAMLAHGTAEDIIAAVAARNNPKQDNSTAVVIKVRENG